MQKQDANRKIKKCDTENRISLYHGQHDGCHSADEQLLKEGANKQVISSQADSLIKISRSWADFFP
ncbi:hypothetical protein, partial [Escherichia sp. MOD1-EC6475]|uniref:hypothetical protein n=1 Tax=Escherichia sp. MOD1-EC6475 TaxID=2162662 RepID=UPI0025733B6A